MHLLNYNTLQVSDFELINEALRVYSERKLDFVDTLLYAYCKVRKYEVYTFDKKLNRLLKS